MCTFRREIGLITDRAEHDNAKTHEKLILTVKSPMRHDSNSLSNISQNCLYTLALLDLQHQKRNLKTLINTAGVFFLENSFR